MPIDNSAGSAELIAGPGSVRAMSLIVYLIVLAIQGLIFGALARLALPGKDPMSIPMTIGLGIAGSFIGGLHRLRDQRRPQRRRLLRRLRLHGRPRLPRAPQPRRRADDARRRPRDERRKRRGYG